MTPDILARVCAPLRGPAARPRLIAALRLVCAVASPARAVLVAAPGSPLIAAYAETLDPAPERISPADLGSAPVGAADLLHLAVGDGDDAARLMARARAAVAPGGLLVVTGVDPTEPVPWPAGTEGAWLPVAMGLVLIWSGASPFSALAQGAIGALAPVCDRVGDLLAVSRPAGTSMTREPAIDRLMERLAEAERTVEAMRRSTSWRLTAPLRWAMTRLARRATGPKPGLGPRTLTGRKAVFAREQSAALDRFLAAGERLRLPRADAPTISVLLVLYNQAPLTLACVRALAAHLDVPAEIIIVDNASSDRTGELLSRLDGAHVVRNTENLHFLRATNQAASLATGHYLLLLNSDAMLRAGSVAAAVSVFDDIEDVGAVGAKIVLLDGTLQEAGSIIWNDGTCVGHGRGDDPDASPYQFRRVVDFCSGAFLLTPRSVFERLGGFDDSFAPAYYEETDYCQRLRKTGLRVVYEPRAVIDHVEFGSSTSSDAALALQRRHHALFRERHAPVLARDHLPPGSSQLLARDADRRRRRVLVIEDRVPFTALGAGYPRAGDLVRGLVTLGWQVTVLPTLVPQADQDAIDREFPREIEFSLDVGEVGLGSFMQARRSYYDTVIVSRPHNMRSWRAEVPGDRRPARLIYDAEAVYAPRETARLSLAGMPQTTAEAKAMLHEEVSLAEGADCVVAVNEREANLFRAGGYQNVSILGSAIVAHATPKPFDARRGALFVGALDDDPSPNTDSMLWFVERIMPRINAAFPQFTLTVAGRSRAARIQALAGPRVRLLGRVDDVTPLFEEARLFVAPTRFAAGLPLKVREAAALGVPVVATGLLAAQLGWTHDVELLVADGEDTFAAACLRLLTDASTWDRLRRSALARIRLDAGPARFAAELDSIMGRGRPA